MRGVRPAGIILRSLPLNLASSVFEACFTQAERESQIDKSAIRDSDSCFCPLWRALSALSLLFHMSIKWVERSSDGPSHQFPSSQSPARLQWTDSLDFSALSVMQTLSTDPPAYLTTGRSFWEIHPAFQGFRLPSSGRITTSQYRWATHPNFAALIW